MLTEFQDFQRDLNTVLFQVRAESLDLEERSVEAVVSTENPVEVFDWRRGMVREVLLIDGCEIPEQTRLLDSHSRGSNDDVLGSVREFRKDKNKIIAKLIFIDGDERAERNWNKVKQGHLTDVSIGYRINPGGFVDIPPDTKAVVRGREFDGGTLGLRVATDWKIKEVSLTPIGADQAAKIRAAMGDFPSDKNRKEISEMLKKEIDKKENGSESPNREGTRNVPEGVSSPPPEPVNVDAVRKEAVKAYQDRRDGIRKAAERTGVKSEIVEGLVNSEKTLDQARAEILDHLRNDRQEPMHGDFSIHTKDDAFRADTLAAGLQLRCGQTVYNPNGSDTEKKRTERLADEGQRFIDNTLLDTCRNALQLEGKRIPHRRDDMIRAAVSTATLASVLSTSVGAKLLMAYNEAPDTTAGLTVDTDLPDFKSVDRFGLGKAANLEPLASGHAANHATISDTVESYKIARYAKQFVVDDQDIINDNLGALQQVPGEMGAAAARLRPDLVYAILMSNPDLQDSVAIFHADHSNLGSGVLASAGLKAGITAMRLQTLDDINLNLAPHFLIVPPTLQFTARELINSQQILITGSTDADRGNRNVLADMVWDLRVEGRLESGVTDPVTGTTTAGSSTAWFMSAMVNMARTIEVGYLAGTGRAPQLRTWRMDREGRYGVGFDIKHDIGAKALDFRGLYKSTGA